MSYDFPVPAVPELDKLTNASPKFPQTSSNICEACHKVASTSPELSNTSLQPSVSSVSNVSYDVVQPHPSSSTRIVIDLNNYSNGESFV